MVKLEERNNITTKLSESYLYVVSESDPDDHSKQRTTKNPSSDESKDDENAGTEEASSIKKELKDSQKEFALLENQFQTLQENFETLKRKKGKTLERKANS